jgi:hypothetical protein
MVIARFPFKPDANLTVRAAVCHRQIGGRRLGCCAAWPSSRTQFHQHSSLGGDRFDASPRRAGGEVGRRVRSEVGGTGCRRVSELSGKAPSPDPLPARKEGDRRPLRYLFNFRVPRVPYAAQRQAPRVTKSGLPASPSRNSRDGTMKFALRFLFFHARFHAAGGRQKKPTGNGKSFHSSFDSEFTDIVC